MPRPLGDHASRRRAVAAAVLRVIDAHGFGGLTLRAVAGELGATTGVVTHYFATKDELRDFALDVLARSVDERQRAEAASGLATLRALVVGMLPTTAEATTANRVWISSWDTVLADQRLTAAYGALYAESRTRLADAVRGAVATGELAADDPDDLAATLHAFTLGLAVQAVLDPERFPPTRQLALADAFLHTLAPAGAPTG